MLWLNTSVTDTYLLPQDTGSSPLYHSGPRPGHDGHRQPWCTRCWPGLHNVIVFSSGTLLIFSSWGNCLVFVVVFHFLYIVITWEVFVVVARFIFLKGCSCFLLLCGIVLFFFDITVPGSKKGWPIVNNMYQYCLIDSLTDKFVSWVSEWMSKCVSDWVGESTTEWSNYSE